MLIHISGNVAHSHNEKLQVETDKYFDEVKKKVEIYESYVISVCKNRIDIPCENIIYDDGMYNCDFDKMR